ncbi:hypothetical protein [Methylobacterium sp. CM6244]
MTRFFLAALAFACAVSVAFAHGAAPSATVLVIPWGNMLGEFSKTALEVLAPVLMAAITYAAGRLPWWAAMWFTTQRIDRMLKTGADYAINAVEGATADKSLSVDVGYTVLKVALERIMGSTPGWLLKEAGGAKGISERLFRVFKFDETVTDANTLSPLIRDLPTLPFAK